MKRLYYVFRGADTAQSISRDLQAAGINVGQLHFLSQDQQALQSAQVQQADLLEEKDISHSGTWGAIFGLVVGALFATYLSLGELAGYISLGSFFLICLLFTCFGAWAGGFVGISTENHHIARFHDALEHGDTLLMVDAYNEQEETQLKQLMHTRHMEASYEGEEANYRVFL